MRPRFTLRTLLIVVTLLGLGLGFYFSQKRIVDERQAALSAIYEQGGGYLVLSQVGEDGVLYRYAGNIERFFVYDGLPTKPATTALLRRWLGDMAIDVLWIPKDMTPPELAERIPDLFPEAEIRRHEIPMTPPGYFSLGDKDHHLSCGIIAPFKGASSR